MSIVVEQVPFWLVLPLRQRILRPHQRITEVRFDGDEVGTHFAAFDDASTIVGVASLIADDVALPEAPAWRLRGMAVESSFQGAGVGRSLMASILEFVQVQGGGGIWCAARVPAVGFYEKFGFITVGTTYVEPEIGPHIQMERRDEPNDESGTGEGAGAPLGWE